MDPNSSSPLDLPRYLHESQFPRGVIKPWMLAATTTMKNGDLYYSNGSIFVQLLAGNANQVLTLVNGVPTWQSQPCAVFSAGRGSTGNIGSAQTIYTDTSGQNSSTETALGNIMPLAGTLKNLWVDVYTNTLNAGNAVYTLMKNGVATALTQTIAHGVTSITGDTTDSVTVAAGDRISVRVATGGASGVVGASFAYCLYQ